MAPTLKGVGVFVVLSALLIAGIDGGFPPLYGEGGSRSEPGGVQRVVASPHPLAFGERPPRKGEV